MHESQFLRKEQCPLCEQEGRDTGKDNLAVYSDGHRFCFGGHGNIDSSRVVDVGSTYEYLPWRGVSEDTFRFYDVKTKINSEGKPVALGYRYPDGWYKVRELDSKKFYSKGEAKAGLFGRDKFGTGTHKYVTITEGELDACSLHQVIQGPVVSVRSSSSAVADCAAEREWLNSFQRVYLAFDDDVAGRNATAAVARLFDGDKVRVVRFAPRKDANEWLNSPDPGALKQLWWNAKKYLPENVICELDQFKKLLEEAPKQGVPYPFPTLTEMTYGIRTGETVLIKAPEKVGKTSLMHAIEYQLLKETNDAVGAIFLEEPAKRHIEALAGQHLKKPIHLPDVACTDGEKHRALDEVLQSDNRLYLYSNFGLNDGAVLLDTIRYLVSACNCRYILLDHISLALGGNSGALAEERKALDWLSTRLEMLVKELDFSLIMVSHVNDSGQTRGSHWLTKIADICIDLQRDTLADDPIERKKIRVSIPYNRYCAKTGPAGTLEFDEVTYTYREIPDDALHSDVFAGAETEKATTQAERFQEFRNSLYPGTYIGTSFGREEPEEAKQGSLAYA